MNDFASVENWELREIFIEQFFHTFDPFYRAIAWQPGKDYQNMVKNRECNSYWSMWFFHFADSKSQIKAKFPLRRSRPPLILLSVTLDSLESFYCCKCSPSANYVNSIYGLRGLYATQNQIWYFPLMNTKFI